MGEITKVAVTVAEMARMTGLGRSRFYQLIGTAFPHPVYCVATRRPFYDENQQKLCLEVRRRNCGIDGKPILFYAKSVSRPVPAKKKVSAAVPVQKVPNDLLDGLAALGLSPSPKEVSEVIQSLYPSGTNGVDSSSILRQVFMELKSKERRSAG